MLVHFQAVVFVESASGTRYPISPFRAAALRHVTSASMIRTLFKWAIIIVDKCDEYCCERETS
jgi:hypothetical protein